MLEELLLSTEGKKMGRGDPLKTVGIELFIRKCTFGFASLMAMITFLKVFYKMFLYFRCLHCKN